MNIRYKKSEGCWAVSGLIHDHNHAPMSELLDAYQHRHKELTQEMQDYILSLVETNIPPGDIQSSYGARFPNGPILTAKDIANKFGITIGGGQRRRPTASQPAPRKSISRAWMVHQVFSTVVDYQ